MELKKLTGQNTVPNIIIGGVHIGGSDAVCFSAGQKKLKDALDAVNVEHKIKNVTNYN